MSSILVKNGRLIHAQGQQNLDILIQDDIIVEISENIAPANHTKIIDAREKWIFPGVIDPHTHMGIPIKSGESADSFASGSRSALHGGVTTILDFTVLEAGQTLKESLTHRQKLAGEAVCDVGIHINITRFEPDLLDEIPDLIASGYNSFKVFTTYEEAGMMLTYAQIEAVATIIARYDGILMVHSEDNETLKSASEAYIERNETHPRHHGLSRPAESEEIAIGKLGEISKRTGCRIYIVHLNTSAGLKQALKYPLLKIETCPHYLLLTDDAYEQKDGQMYVASPPLRKLEDKNALWEAIRKGKIDTIGSDHCPFCLKDKKPGIPFQEIPNGMGGVETLFPTLLAQFVQRDLDLSLLVKMTSWNPAHIFSINHLKGTLQPKHHADLIIVNPEALSDVWEAGLETILDWNAYSSQPAIFPEMVIRRGELVVKKGAIQDPDFGFLVTTPTPSV